MQRKKEKEPSLMHSWLESRWAAVSSAAQRSHLRFSQRLRWAPFGRRSRTKQPVRGQRVQSHSASADCEALPLSPHSLLLAVLYPSPPGPCISLASSQDGDDVAFPPQTPPNCSRLLVAGLFPPSARKQESGRL